MRPTGPINLRAATIAAAAIGRRRVRQRRGSSLAPQVGQKAPDTYLPGQPYQLSKEELALDCKKLTGRMQVRILPVRDGARSRAAAARSPDRRNRS